ncbi:MAG: hypothetical protein LBC73_05245 [Oscillospiraceae bacterium]|jgi:hypothetical protein|nr:hypothetical protein [Oscillospiraceae bacterium]
MKKKNYIRSFIFVFAMLFIGMLVYVFLRSSFLWITIFPNHNQPIIDITWLPTPISIFILYHLSDVLWALAFAETVFIIMNNYTLGVVIALVSTVLFETAQYINIIPGTGDIWDIFFVAVALSVYWVIKKYIDTKEKRTNDFKAL